MGWQMPLSPRAGHPIEIAIQQLTPPNAPFKAASAVLLVRFIARSAAIVSRKPGGQRGRGALVRLKLAQRHANGSLRIAIVRHCDRLWSCPRIERLCDIAFEPEVLDVAVA